MTGVSTNCEEVPKNPFCEKKKSHFNETSGIFPNGSSDLPVGKFSRGNTGYIFENTVESGF